jgi:hypothetical protein
VLSQREAEAFVQVQGLNSRAIISITDPGLEPAQLVAFGNMLRLQFCDNDVCGPRSMQPEDAMRILRFARQHRELELFVHCEHGMSRSPAVANFLGRWLGCEVLGAGTAPNALVEDLLARAGLQAGIAWLDLRLVRVAIHGAC